MKPKVLFVCWGNICRSPCAHAVLQQLRPDLTVDSAGTQAHVGEETDIRMRKVLAAHDIQFTHKSRQFTKRDAEFFDFIFVSDAKRLIDAKMMVDEKHWSKFQLIDFLDERDIPDPYYEDNFAEVFDIISRCCHNIAKKVS